MISGGAPLGPRWVTARPPTFLIIFFYVYKLHLHIYALWFVYFNLLCEQIYFWIPSNGWYFIYDYIWNLHSISSTFFLCFIYLVISTIFGIILKTWLAFASKTVFENTLNKAIPEGSQLAEYLSHKVFFFWQNLSHKVVGSMLSLIWLWKNEKLVEFLGQETGGEKIGLLIFELLLPF